MTREIKPVSGDVAGRSRDSQVFKKMAAPPKKALTKGPKESKRISVRGPR